MLRKLLPVVLLLSLCLTTSSAQQPIPLPSQPVMPKNLFATQTDKTNFNLLLNTARSSGSVQVIVGLQTSVPLQGQTDFARTQSIRSTQQSLIASLSGQNVTVIRQFDYIPYITVRVDAAALQAVQRSPLVTSLYLDGIAALTLGKSATQVEAKGANGAWAMGYNGTGQTVAVLDSGVDKTHPAFGGRVVSEACYSGSINPSELEPYGGGTISSACPGGAPSSTASNSGLNCPDEYTGCSHGTHVAGIVASNDSTYRGIAPNANIIAMQVFSLVEGAVCQNLTFSDKCILTSDSDYISGLERVYALRNTYSIAAVNMSLGGGGFTSQSTCDSQNAPAKAAIDLLRSAKIATVAASGNDSYVDKMGAPGCISSAISVGSVSSLNINPQLGSADTVSGFSNSASFLNLLAPGGDCLFVPELGGCLLATDGITSTMPDNQFGMQPGTSMASPHVAGAWALLKQANPALTVDQVKNALVSTGKPITDTRAGANNRIKPRIRIKEALVSLGAQPMNTPTNTPMVTLTPTPLTPESTLSPTDTPNGTPILTDTPDGTVIPSDTPDGTTTPTVEITDTPDGITPTATLTPIVGEQLLINGDFEAKDGAVPDLDPWTGKRLTGDKIKCDKPEKPIAHGGTCAFMFKGSVGENSAILQTLSDDIIASGDTITLSGFINAKGAVSTTIKVLVGYADTQHPKGKISLKYTAPTSGYAPLTGAVTLSIVGEVSSFKVKIGNKGTSGKVFYDDLRLIKTSAEGLLSLP